MEYNDNPFLQCPECIFDRNKLKGVISDIFPTERLKINTVLAAFDSGVVDEIQKSSRMDTFLQGRMKKVLIEDYGISPENASWATTYWLTCYGVQVLGKEIDVLIEKPIQKPNQEKTPKSSPVLPPKAEGFLSIAKMAEHEKIPKDKIERYPDIENKFGITDFRCAISKDYDYERYCSFKVTGEYIGKSSKYLLIVIMLYNANNELIGAGFGEEIDQGFKGRATFSTSLQAPTDEYISKAIVRLTPDPVWD